MRWLLFILLSFCLDHEKSAPIEVTLESGGKAIFISTLDPDIEPKSLEVAVYFGLELDEALPQVIGSTEYSRGGLIFKPKYGFSPGAAYRVEVGYHKKEDIRNLQSFQTSVSIPEVDRTPKTLVTNVYPTGDKLPMNQLKLYIEFSTPMRMGSAYEHIKLYREPEHVLEEEAFLAMPEELWDPERKRLTIFFDPGRIKRGVQPNLQLGLPLVEGRRYRLVIDRGWLDSNGARLLEGYEKSFSVIEVDRKSPQPNDWEVVSPEMDSRSPLAVNFRESMDYGLLHSAIVVVDADEQPVAGEISVAEEESLWQFVPHQPWAKGEYRLLINPWLEDLAGNNLRRKFDVDLHDPADRPKEIDQVVIPFKTITQTN